jgi:hypothetical protein
MKRSRFSEEQIIWDLAGGRRKICWLLQGILKETCRKSLQSSLLSQVSCHLPFSVILRCASSPAASGKLTSPANWIKGTWQRHGLEMVGCHRLTASLVYCGIISADEDPSMKYKLLPLGSYPWQLT